jgi:2'-5' RNA ligase
MSEIFSQKYCIVAFLEQVDVGAVFDCTAWPLHVTIVSVLALNMSQGLLIDLKKLVESQTVIDIKVGQDHCFDDANQTRVSLVTPSLELVNLHARVMELLRKYNVVLNEPTHADQGYTPHITIQKTNRSRPGQKLKLTSLSIIDMFPGGNHLLRNVLSTISLS